MKSNTCLKDESILTLLALNNLIVPEIQREYVWGENKNVLEKFITDVKSHAKKCESCKRVHSNNINNIGFLYSYKPPYTELEKGRYLDEFLIDGQQRITTIFLLLLSRAVKEHRIKDFLNICRIHDDGYAECFNYKVRSLTQDFMNCLVKHVIDNGDTSLDFLTGFLESNYENDHKNKSTDRPSWILSDFEQDPTISSICKSLGIIIESFKDDESLYFDFLLENIHFWHFKTEATSQGEELYISMNSTGEQLSTNEIKKAEILSKENIIDLGKKWETWQNLFWWKRCVGISKPTGEENADKGFNNYLLCIEDLERKFEQGIPKSDTFQIYMDALCLVTNTSCEEKSSEREDILKNKLNELKLPTEWLLDFREKIWNILNTQAWSIGKEITDAAFQKTMLFWPWMYFYKSLKINRLQESSLKDDLNDYLEDLLRILHLFYIRYYCDKRDYRKIKTAIDKIIEESSYKNALDKIDEVTVEESVSDENSFYIEEKELQKLYNNSEGLEPIIWNIQNIPVIRDGSDCGSTTVKAFVGKLQDTDSANRVCGFLRDIFELDKQEPRVSPNTLKSLLLFYSLDSNDKEDPFWQEKTNGRFFAKEWKRIVRSNAFWRFFEDCDQIPLSDIQAILSEKRKTFFENKNLNYDFPLPRFEKAIIYDALCSLLPNNETIWENGNVGFGIDSTDHSRPTLFSDKDELYRIKEYMWYYRYDLPDKWQDILKQEYKSLTFPNYPIDIQ